MKFHIILILFVLISPSVGLSATPQQNNADPAPPSNAAAGAAAIDYATARFDRIAEAIRINEKITIDGKLEEPAWGAAKPAANFIQWEPEPGAPATAPTEVRILYDDKNLYIGAICFDGDMTHLVVNELKEDFGGTDSDGLAFILDTLHDRRSGFFFGTNPVGAKRDSQITNEEHNFDWDGVWDVNVTQNEKSWIAEFVIPLKTLRFSSDPAQEWGFQVLRRLRRRNEDSFWSPLPRRYRVQRVSMAGTLKGIENIRQGQNLKIKPYVIGGVQQVRSNNVLSNNFDRDGGFDVKYGLTQQLTLDLTYRTDFSQVEVDQQQVNLTRFSLFFPEKREFFLENSGTFAFGLPIPTYANGGGPNNTRNNLIPFFSRSIGLSSQGTPIPIIGGTRISGQVGSYDVGFLAMKTESLGATPSNTFVVSRVKRNVFRNSAIGVLWTNRDSSVSRDYNRVYGGDAYFRFDRLDFSSYIMKSQTPGKTGADMARLFEVGWRDDDLSVIASNHQVQANFNPEVGYIRRKDTEISTGIVSWRPRPRPNPHVRNFELMGTVNYYEDGSGKRLETREHDLQFSTFFQNSAEVEFRGTRTFDRLEDAFTVSRVPIPAGEYSYDNYSVTYRADRSRSISGRIQLETGEFWGGRRKSQTGALTLRPNYHLNIDVNFTRNKGRLPNGAFVSNIVGTRVLYAFTSKVFLNAFVQYDNSAHQFSSNIRFNIIHHPMSDLFVVYNDRRDTSSNLLLERALLVKLTHLFSF